MSYEGACRALDQANRELSAFGTERRLMVAATQAAANAASLLETIRVNVDNESLSDKDFRQFVRNSLPQ